MQSSAFKREVNNLKKSENERRSDHSGPRQPKSQLGTLSGTATQKNQSDLLTSLAEPQSANHQNPKEKKKKNVFGLDFEIPDELSELIAREMKQQSDAGGKPNNPL